ncbi:type IVB secretion system protein IcmH/DotU [Photobacterium makurazakiensis]|uniref:type IVB secretion system protein IcmH/DotU n=1 Tax=Photobacterium makurazakiensis TaxID=2910234 RepID=UPI003D0FCE71
MNDLFDEETITLAAVRPETKSKPGTQGIPLSHANVLKNKARYMLAQQNGQPFENRLLNESSDLLSFAVSVKRMQCPEDLFAFRAELKQAITELKYKIAKLEYPPSVADKTCFMFAAMLDEQIVHSPWGEAAGWENQSLVSELFGIKNGGEQFYIVAERALLQPVLLVDLLELIFILLKVGFKGRFRVDGREQLNTILNRLEEAVFAKKRLYTQSDRVAPITTDTEQAGQSQRPKKPIKISRFIVTFIVLICCLWGGLHYWYESIAPQKAMPFTQLTDFTDDFYRIESAQDNEYIYTSTPADMGRSAGLQPAIIVSIPEEITVGSQVWAVQLATFNTRQNVERFQSQYEKAIPNTSIGEWGGKYRLLSFAQNKEVAIQTLATAKQQGIEDAFIFSEKR